MSHRQLGVSDNGEIHNSMLQKCGCRLRVCHHFGLSFQPAHQNENKFYDLACRVLFTEKPIILLLDSQRRLVSHSGFEQGALEKNGIFCWGRERRVGFRDAVSQKYLIRLMMQADHLQSGASGQAKSCFIPTSTGWPVVVLEGDDQKPALDKLKFEGFEADMVTLLLRGNGGFNRTQSLKMRQAIG